jgi:thioredoxin 1
MFTSITRLAFRAHAVKNMAEFKKIVGDLKTPYVLDFYADWCGPCKMLTPIITKLEEDSKGKWTLIKVNVDEEELAELVDKHQVQGVPTLAFYKGA